MIVSNDYLFIKSMLDKGVSPKIVKELCREFNGWRIYFRGKRYEQQEMKEEYNAMMKAGYTEKQALEVLSSTYNKSMQRVKEIVRTQKGLFDEV